MILKTDIKHYADLSKDELYGILALRTSVFVVEQNCPYQELDSKDQEAYHLILRDSSEILGTLRILLTEYNINNPIIFIGRVVIHTSIRGKKWGHHIMNTSLQFIDEKWKNAHVIISAQEHLQTFYKKHGFISTDKHYLEDGIPHVEMLLNLKNYEV